MPSIGSSFIIHKFQSRIVNVNEVMSTKVTYQKPDERGYYGHFGGAYIPEMLHRNVEELQARYLSIMGEASFQKEYKALLKDYVGRPTPLYFATRLSREHKTNIFLKREDLCSMGWLLPPYVH
jgi:tryptophan synthase beta chain